MIKSIPLNFDWLYTPHFSQKVIDQPLEFEWHAVNIPHNNIDLPLSYFDEKSYQFVSTYRREIDLSDIDPRSLIYINFEGVMTSCRVLLNNVEIGQHDGGFSEFKIWLNNPQYPEPRHDGTDQITVIVDSRELEHIPPFGGQIDYLCFGGIYREVQLLVTADVYIDNVFAKSQHVLDDDRSLEVEVYLSNPLHTKCPVNIEVELFDEDNVVTSTTISANIHSEQQTVVTSLDRLGNVELWSPDNPKLYTLRVTAGEDRYQTKVGFRCSEFKKDGFFLNGEKLKLLGLNRHQSYPYQGYAMPRNAQRMDADILKNELGLNIVRTSHYPQSRHFLDRCDELGLLVFEEIPGWQHIGDEVWQANALRDVRSMITRDWNHPSVILWGVRINESNDHHEFYMKTNALAKSLDPTRATGGVRCIENSELLEDVYTMNDFILDLRSYHTRYNNQPIALRGQQQVTGLDKKVPYLVTEYVGHMYPTKKQDGEERQREHAYRNLHVIDAMMQDDDISGAIGWCAFDYNTHKDFGSGDRVCHHGVMDIFRTPKFTASVYRSQKPVTQEVILEPMSVWSLGDSCEGVYGCAFFVSTNCDKVVMTICGESHTYYPDRGYFKGVINPPVIIPGVAVEWGLGWHPVLFEGYSNDEKVAEKRLLSAPVFTTLSLSADEPIIYEGDSWETTRIVVKALDQAGNPCYYNNTIVNIEVTGAAELIGPNLRTLQGGTSAFWLRTNQARGEIDVRVTTSDQVTTNLKLEVRDA
ncbi:glycoside hydrolase family 2 TIM barrel-domain containing protein [Vibrio sp. WXL103]|uniref:glycoside hydrolase family 2 protein n=1 Tax=Vibrio sp. WXL103 TaxID=3450710 RepID=UPI003EC83933